MPVEVFLMFQWLIFLVDIAGNEMPPYAPNPPRAKTCIRACSSVGSPMTRIPGKPRSPCS
jgi:hypothetical protein